MLVVTVPFFIMLNQYYLFNGNKNHFLFSKFVYKILSRTNQHSCNDVNSDCTILLQYTCDAKLRDGTREQRRKIEKVFCECFIFVGNRLIPVTAAAEGDAQYRLTEDLTSYLNCRVRSRDKNLFTADQVI